MPPRPLLLPALAVLLAACPAGTPEAVDSPAVAEAPVMRDGFTAGPGLDDPAALRAWLEAEAERDGARPTFRLPVTLDFAEDAPNVIASARVGALAVSLDDTALGIPLADRARVLCSEVPCALWLEAQWGPLVALPGPPGAADGPPRVAVRAVLRPAHEPPDSLRVWLRR